MMKVRNLNKRTVSTTFSLNELVPKNHIIRKIENAIDLSFIHKEVKHLYSPYGRESIDPVVLFKIIIIQYIFGIKSMRQTIKEIDMNIAYRWYLGYQINEPIPHFSTFGKNYSRRFKDSNIFETIFSEILNEVISLNFFDDTSVFIDGTHIKACANNKKSKNELVEKKTKFYQDELQKEISDDREIHGKKKLNFEKESEFKNTKISTTDPDCGIFHKGEHKIVFAYSSNTACDKNGFILDFHVTPGNSHDSTSFPALYSKLNTRFPNIKNYVLDAGYKIPAIARLLIEDNKTPIMPYKRPMTKKGFYKKYDYVYDEQNDCYLCPRDQILKYSTTNRNGYKEYKSNPRICENCLYSVKCTESKNSMKVVTRHVWEEYIEKIEDIRHTTGSKAIYNLRKETIERVFADAKENHRMRYTQLKGIAKIKMELSLIFACMNLKKLALWKSKNGLFLFIPTIFTTIFKIFKKYQNIKSRFNKNKFYQICLSTL